MHVQIYSVYLIILLLHSYLAVKKDGKCIAEYTVRSERVEQNIIDGKHALIAIMYILDANTPGYTAKIKGCFSYQLSIHCVLLSI